MSERPESALPYPNGVAAIEMLSHFDLLFHQSPKLTVLFKLQVQVVYSHRVVVLNGSLLFDAEELLEIEAYGFDEQRLRLFRFDAKAPVEIGDKPPVNKLIGCCNGVDAFLFQLVHQAVLNTAQDSSQTSERRGKGQP